MSLYEKWSDIAYKINNQSDYEKFWGDYLPREKEFYKYLLSHKDEKISGNIAELGKLFGQEPMTVIGFMDGIMDSLKEQAQSNIEDVTEDTVFRIDVDFEKLYYNMHKAKATWLIELEEWDDVFTKEKRAEITRKYKDDKTYVNKVKVGRNDPCPCGSGKKYKKCCDKSA